MKKLLAMIGVAMCTAAALAGADLQRRIDEAAAAGGGRVAVKAGVYHTGTLRLRSHVELHLEEGAVLLASTNKADYAEFPRDVCSVSPESSYTALIMAWDAEDISITGKGVIDGRGPTFYDRKPPRGHWPKPKFRPLMVQFVRCKGVRLEGATFKDSPMWTMFIRLCEDVAVDAIRVEGDQRMINNDGIDFDGCRRVRVGNSFFKTGDDCIILRAMRERQDEHIVCEDVVVSNCVLNSTCQSIRMGAPSDDTIRNAIFKNIKVKGSNGIFFDYPARYVRPYDDGYMDISGIVFDGFEGSSYGSAVQIVAEPGIKIRGVRDVTFKNFNVKSAKPLRFVGNADSVLSNIVLENFTAEIKSGNPYQAVATEPLTFRNCTFNGKKAPDKNLVTPRGKREPLNRSNRSSWETLNQSLSAAPKLAFQVYAVRDLCEKDFVGTLKAAKALGYEGVETGRFYGLDAKGLKAACDDAGLKLVALQLYPHNLTEPQLGETIKFCKECGCRRINVAWYKGSEENPNDWQLLVNVLNHAAEVCAKEGIAVAYHNHDQEFSMKFGGRSVWDWLYAEDGGDAMRQVTATPRFSRRVLQELDCGNCVLGGGDPLACIAAHPRRNPTVHVMPALGGPQSSAEVQKSVPTPGECGVGSATDRVDWRRVIPALAADGVEWLVVKPTAHPGSLADLKASIEYLRRLLPQK